MASKNTRKNQNPRKKKSRRLKNWLINIFLLLLFVVGLALVFNTQIRNWLIQENGKSYLLDKVTSEDIEKNMAADVSFDFGAVESISTEAVLLAQFGSDRLPVIGGIAVPSVEINLPIFKGLGNEALLAGAGTMKADQQMGKGNYALASHRVQDMVSLFSPLEYVELGALIYITDLQNVYTYKITYKERIDPSRVELIEDQPDRKMITLITCGDMSAITRIVVQGDLDSVTPIDKANDDMMNAFQMQQRTL